ncbi:DUF4276 family protein [Rahnella bonaserana]|uniref:DUF4276 family protein n=1 Tax=Rahnella bonaserana TaxID=2816248 RepID=UPI0024C2F1DF|nr:DUF4276 family protein [Rahnella bonaserana]WHZ39272.1 DUF4276 family protein [Rahnella bonaserana]
MNFNILVEGQSEIHFINKILTKIYGKNGTTHSWKIHKHQGVGSIPANLNAPPNKNTNSLLNLLPAKLRAYEKIATANDRVIVVLDLDNNNLANFNTQLSNLKNICSPNVDVRFPIASEELEAWYLGDRAALMSYNPLINTVILNSYVQDSIIGTWELLMDADDPSWRNIGTPKWKSSSKKVEWSKKISTHMDPNINLSPSFNNFLVAFV